MAQKKLDSHIVLAIKKNRVEPPFDKPTKLDPDLKIEADGRVLVDVKAQVSAPLLDAIKADGGTVINSFASMQSIRALIPLMRLETLAERADVTFIAPAAQAATNSSGSGAAHNSSIKP